MHKICVDSVVRRGQPSWKLIVGHFGQDVLREDGQIDRARLAGVIFDSEEKRRLLNSCTHPYIQRRMVWQVVKYFLKGERGARAASTTLSLTYTTACFV